MASGTCCWKPLPQRMTIVSANPLPAPNGSGVIPLASYPDCTGPHAGEHRNEAVYIVGWRTEHERLFKPTDAKAAVNYRNSIDRDLQLAPVGANHICNQAIADLYGE